MNKVILTGRQTAEANVTYTAEGTAIARWSLAVDRRGKDGADFPTCVAFGKTAEFIEKYGAKGKKWNLEGRIQTGSYEKDGRKIYTTDVIVSELEFGESKGDENKINAPVRVDDSDFMSIPDEELPFV